MSSIETRQLARRLPFWNTAAGTYDVLITNFSAFLTRAWRWMVVAFLLHVPIGLFAVHINSLELLLWMPLVTAVCALPVAMRWQQFILLNSADRHMTSTGQQRIRFLVYALLLVIVIVGPAWAASSYSLLVMPRARFTAVLAALLAAAAAVPFVVRVSLVLPAAALGVHRFGVRQAWILSRGSTWRLAAASIAATVPFLPAHILRNIASLILLRVSSYTVALFQAIDIMLIFALLGVQTTMIALAFQWFVQAERRPA
jgi:hypothetical protein